MMRPWLGFDTPLYLALNANTEGGLLALARFVSADLPSAAGVLLAIGVLRPATRTLAWRAVVAMLLAWCAVHTVQALIPLPRPAALGLGTQWISQGPRPGFPSMHTSVAFALWAALAIRRSPWAWLALGVAVLMGWSRICLGAHFPTDVLAGAVTGSVAALLGLGLSQGWQRLRRRGYASAHGDIPAIGR